MNIEIAPRKESESSILAKIRNKFNAGPVRLFRNNSGIAEYANGTKVRYGLGGTGGSDLIGFKTITVTPDMIGRRLAIFCAVEVKKPGGKKATPEQINFIGAIKTAGGLSGIAMSEADVAAILDIKNL